MHSRFLIDFVLLVGVCVYGSKLCKVDSDTQLQQFGSFYTPKSCFQRILMLTNVQSAMCRRKLLIQQNLEFLCWFSRLSLDSSREFLNIFRDLPRFRYPNSQSLIAYIQTDPVGENSIRFCVNKLVPKVRMSLLRLVLFVQLIILTVVPS